MPPAALAVLCPLVFSPHSGFKNNATPMTDAFSDALYFACGKTSGSKATRDYQPRSFLASLAGSASGKIKRKQTMQQFIKGDLEIMA
ncbi:hypothetical protein TUM19329_11120 [Legionella antarctica]|uniref:Uncharacterized protein n=1 Tax=Legionella antarctica TaxID=2708020 RepID=A0A6F8T2Q6_9GAMM|nr:hypothetical protein TUM19329_11120 [Legionella antarctica]